MPDINLNIISRFIDEGLQSANSAMAALGNTVTNMQASIGKGASFSQLMKVGEASKSISEANSQLAGIGVTAQDLNSIFASNSQEAKGLQASYTQAFSQAGMMAQQYGVSVSAALGKTDYYLATAQDFAQKFGTSMTNALRVVSGVGVAAAREMTIAGKATAEAANLMGTSLNKMGSAATKARTNFMMNFFSIMFTGQQVQRTMLRLATSTISTFMKISEGSTSASKAFTELGAMWDILKFAIGNAIATALEPLIPIIIGIIAAIVDWVSRHPRLTAAIILTALALGALMAMVGTLVLLIGSLKNIMVMLDFEKFSAGALKFGTSMLTWAAANPILAAIAVLLAIGAAAMLSFPGLRAQVAESFKPVGGAIMNLCYAILGLLVPSLNGLEPSWRAVGAGFTWLANIVAGVLTLAFNVITTALLSFRSVLEGVVDYLLAIFTTIGTGIAKILGFAKGIPIFKGFSDATEILNQNLDNVDSSLIRVGQSELALGNLPSVGQIYQKSLDLEGAATKTTATAKATGEAIGTGLTDGMQTGLADGTKTVSNTMANTTITAPKFDLAGFSAQADALNKATTDSISKGMTANQAVVQSYSKSIGVDLMAGAPDMSAMVPNLEAIKTPIDAVAPSLDTMGLSATNTALATSSLSTELTTNTIPTLDATTTSINSGLIPAQTALTATTMATTIPTMQMQIALQTQMNLLMTNYTVSLNTLIPVMKILPSISASITSANNSEAASWNAKAAAVKAYNSAVASGKGGGGGGVGDAIKKVVDKVKSFVGG